MSIASRKLSVGDYALTDYNSSGSRPPKLVRVKIVAVDRIGPRGSSQSGVMFQVRPLLKNGDADSWYCADWFESFETA